MTTYVIPRIVKQIVIFRLAKADLFDIECFKQFLLEADYNLGNTMVFVSF